jgi:hypothetical protein
MAAQSNAWVYGRSLVGFVSRRGYGCLSVVSIVCCQLEVSATGWSFVQRSPTKCGVSECDREASIMRRPWYTKGCCAMEEEFYAETRHFTWYTPHIGLIHI